MSQSRRRFPMLLILSALLPAPAWARPVNLDRTLFVSPVAGNPVASGDRLLAALAGITDAAPDNPWLLRIEPGVYDLGGRSLAMKPHVDIEGSGQGVTTIQSTVPTVGTIEGAKACELRDLTVVNTAADRAVALSNDDDAFVASRVTAIARGGSDFSTAVVNFAAGTFRDITARAESSRSATGVSSDGGRLERVRAFASGSLFAYGVFNAVSDGELVEVTAQAQSPSYAAAIRNEGGAPVLRDVRAIAHGGNVGEGIVNAGGTAARVRGAVIDATAGGDFANGIRNESSTAAVSDATIVVSAPNGAFGSVNLLGGAPSLRNVSIRVTGGGFGVGVQSNDPVVTVEGSTIESDWLALRAWINPASAIHVGTTRVGGGVWMEASAGVVRCVASYDAAFTPVGANCLP